MMENRHDGNKAIQQVGNRNRITKGQSNYFKQSMLRNDWWDILSWWKMK